MTASFMISMIVAHTICATIQVFIAVSGRGSVALSLFFLVLSVAYIAFTWTKLLEQVR